MCMVDRHASWLTMNKSGQKKNELGLRSLLVPLTGSQFQTRKFGPAVSSTLCTLSKLWDRHLGHLSHLHKKS